MNIKKTLAFTLVEILIAIGIGGVIITTAFGTIGNIYLMQKRVRISQDFHSECRFLMERIVQMIRNNTIDYDRFFTNPGGCDDDYATNFYQDTNGDGVRDRNLGGLTASGAIDVCTEAWTGSQGTLYLINGTRTLQTAIRETLDGSHKVEAERRLGADLDNDGKVDLWSNSPIWNRNGLGLCEIQSGVDFYPIIGEASSQDFCSQAHPWTVLSPNQIDIENLFFEPSPTRDPFLSFAINDAQIHPHVFVAIKARLRSPENFGLEISAAPDTLLQTVASSRVFGNTRK
ncbi:hypothetical protein K9L27_00330 [Candidatus Gracilibacteria bacterium]|nr:hypothetical protein [Candidatus Gracilibacteria bacterium]